MVVVMIGPWTLLWHAIRLWLQEHQCQSSIPSRWSSVPSIGDVGTSSRSKCSLWWYHGQRHHHHCVCSCSNILSFYRGCYCFVSLLFIIHYNNKQYRNFISYTSLATLYFLEHHWNKYPYKIIATYVVSNNNDITFKSNHSEHIVFKHKQMSKMKQALQSQEL